VAYFRQHGLLFDAQARQRLSTGIDSDVLEIGRESVGQFFPIRLELVDQPLRMGGFPVFLSSFWTFSAGAWPITI
jgi:hypothetical protein